MATGLRSSVRESDFVGRHGGEEFLILLPDTGKEQARVAEKVRAADRALYAAKGKGRNRVELFVSPDRRAPQASGARRGAERDTEPRTG